MSSKARISGNLVSNTNLFVDPVTDNTGIGTTTPSSKLTIFGDVKTIGIVSAVSYYGDGSKLTGISSAKTFLTDIGSDGLTFYTGKAAVGIATTEPHWTIRRSLSSSAGIVTSTGVARNIAWINRSTGIYT